MTVPKQNADLGAVQFRDDGDSFVPEPSDEFVETPEIVAVCERAQAYLDAGYAIHFSGTSGIGKTTLAFHMASQLGRPAVLIHGNHEFGSSDLIGANAGYRKSKVVDNFIHSVVKTQEEMKQFWVDNRLAKACRRGYTLIYDEFNRSTPEANNVLLSVLEERILNVPDSSGRGYVMVHPNFRAIFTSNPEEYAGTHRAQDALLDRMITLKLPEHSFDAEVRITAERSGIDLPRAHGLVKLTRLMRENNKTHSLRSTIALAKVLRGHSREFSASNPFFVAVCQDVLLSHAAEPKDAQRIIKHIEQVWGKA